MSSTATIPSLIARLTDGMPALTESLVGISPDIALPPLWAYPAAIMLLILVGVTSLGLAKLYVKVKVALGME